MACIDFNRRQKVTVSLKVVLALGKSLKVKPIWKLIQNLFWAFSKVYERNKFSHSSKFSNFYQCQIKFWILCSTLTPEKALKKKLLLMYEIHFKQKLSFQDKTKKVNASFFKNQKIFWMNFQSVAYIKKALQKEMSLLKITFIFFNLTSNSIEPHLWIPEKLYFLMSFHVVLLFMKIPVSALQDWENVS